MFLLNRTVNAHKKGVLINKINKQFTVKFINYTRLLGQTYARATETYSGGASPEITVYFTSECLQYPQYPVLQLPTLISLWTQHHSSVIFKLSSQWRNAQTQQNKPFFRKMCINMSEGSEV